LSKIELLLKNVPMISEQTLVFQSNFSQQTPPKLYDPLSKLRFGTYGIDFVKHGTISAKFIDSVRLNIARKLKRQHGFGYGYVPIHLLLRVVLKLVWAGEGAIAFGKGLNRVKLFRICKVKP
jgi:ribosomal protein L16/L10AE